MSDKEAKVRLSLNTGDFIAKLQQTLKQSAQASTELANALGKVEGEAEKVKQKGSAVGAAFGKAFGAIQKDLTGIAGQLKSVGGMALSLGGAFSVGSALKGVVDLRSGFSELALRMELTSKGAVKWQDLQKSAQAAAALTTRSTDEMRASMAKVYADTGDQKFAVDSMVAIGTAATATGKSVEEVAGIATVLNRKFGASAKELPAMLERVFEKADSGGMSFEQLSGSLDDMAGAAQRAGLKGADGLTFMLESVRQLDSKLGSGKAAAGLQGIFDVFEQTPQKAKQLEDLLNVGNVEGLIDSSKRVRFGKDDGIIEKTQKILTKYTDVSGPLDGGAGKYGGTVVKQFKNMFTGDASRAMQAGLLDPFEQAFKKARAEGKSLEKARELGMEAFRENVRKLSESTADGAKLQAAAAAAAEDPKRKFAAALQELNDAFASSPEVQSAIQDLAKALPGLAKEVGGWVKWAAKNPLEAVMSALAARIAMTGGASLGTSLAQSALNKFASSLDAATVRGSTALDKLVAGVGVAAAAFAAWKAGKAGIDQAFKATGDMDSDLALADAATGKGATLEAKKAALERVREIKKDTEGFNVAEGVEGVFGLLSGDGGGTRAGERRKRTLTTEAILEKQIADDERRRKESGGGGGGAEGSTGAKSDSGAAPHKEAAAAHKDAARGLTSAARAIEQASTRLQSGAGGGANGLPGKGPTGPGTLG